MGRAVVLGKTSARLAALVDNASLCEENRR